MRRRTFLAVMGAGMVTGCNALGGNRFTNAEEPFSNVQNATGLDDGDTGKSAQATLPTGNYASFGFTLREPSDMTMEGQAVSGGPIDTYVMTIDQFNNYQRNKQIVGRNGYEVGAESSSTITMNEQLQSGEYLIVFDNTYVGGTEPSGEARIQFNFVLTDTGQSGTDSTPTPS